MAFLNMEIWKKANNLFGKMEKEGCAPNLISFTMLLQGVCIHNEALKVVELLQKLTERNIFPNDTHDIAIYKYFVQRRKLFEISKLDSEIFFPWLN